MKKLRDVSYTLLTYSNSRKKGCQAQLLSDAQALTSLRLAGLSHHAFSYKTGQRAS